MVPAMAGVTPIADCGRYDAVTGILTIAYGYDNPLPVPTTLSLTSDKFFPAPLFRGQPFVFYPGTHHRVFATSYGVLDFGSLTWTLDGSSLTVSYDPAATGSLPVTPSSLPLCDPYAAVPVVNAVLPAAARLAGGTRIVTLGKNFEAAAGRTDAVMSDTSGFGGKLPARMSCLSDELCSVIVPAPLGGSGGDSALWLNTLRAGAGAAVAFRFEDTLPPGPVLAAVVPPRGPTVGGTTVTIAGGNFQTDGSTQVYFGATPSTGVACASATTCTAVVPPGTGSQRVFVVTAGGASDPAAAAAQFDYVEAGISAIAPDPGHAGVIYAIVGGLGVYRTGDGGAHWQEANAGLGSAEVRALAVAVGGTAYVGTFGDGIFASTYQAGGGVAWLPLNGSGSGSLGDLRVKSLALHPGSPGSLYVGTPSGVYCSDDGGASWAACGNGLP